MIEAIGPAIEILTTVPKIAELVKDLYSSIQSFRKADEQFDALPVIVRTVAKKETENLERLVEEYYRYDKDPSVGEIEKRNHKKRIAAQICILLETLVAISSTIDGYDTLKELFCSSVPNAL